MRDQQTRIIGRIKPHSGAAGLVIGQRHGLGRFLAFVKEASMRFDGAAFRSMLRTDTSSTRMCGASTMAPRVCASWCSAWRARWQ